MKKFDELKTSTKVIFITLGLLIFFYIVGLKSENQAYCNDTGVPPVGTDTPVAINNDITVVTNELKQLVVKKKKELKEINESIESISEISEITATSKPSKPVVVTSKPVITSKPVTTSKPVVVTSKPVITSKPVTTSKPVVVTSKPSNSNIEMEPHDSYHEVELNNITITVSNNVNQLVNSIKYGGDNAADCYAVLCKEVQRISFHAGDIIVKVESQDGNLILKYHSGTCVYNVTKGK